VNVPVTYPPAEVNGVMISGPLSPRDPDRSAWPPGIIQELQEATGRRWWQYDRSDYVPSRPREFLEALEQSNATMAAFACELLARERFDVLMLVLNLVDAASHFFWHYMDAKHPFHDGADPGLTEAVRDAYHYIDGLVGRLTEAAGRDADVMLVSDHGFGPLLRMVNLNNFLAERGYLALKRSPAAGAKRLLRRLGLTPARVMAGLERVGLDWLVYRMSRGLRNRLIGTMGSYADVDWSKTVCYSRGHMGQVYFTPEVRADPDRFAALRAEVAHALRTGLVDPDSGQPVVSELLFGTDIYAGPHASEGPDIFLVLDNWETIAYPLLSSGSALFTPHVQKNRYGNHRMNGMFCAAGPSFRSAGRLQPLSILDVAPTVLRVRGVAVPEHIDGSTAEGVVCDHVLARAPQEAPPSRSVAPDGDGQADLSEDEQRQRRERLRDLGYL
jgi:predicted AlkP superfamily phosphohydrolase/phosphomutase